MGKSIGSRESVNVVNWLIIKDATHPICVVHATNHIAYQHLITGTGAVLQTMSIIVVPLGNEEGQSQMQYLLHFLLKEIKLEQDEEEE